MYQVVCVTGCSCVTVVFWSRGSRLWFCQVETRSSGLNGSILGSPDSRAWNSDRFSHRDRQSRQIEFKKKNALLFL